MNSFRPIIQRTAVRSFQQQTRTKATTAAAPPRNKIIPEKYQYDLKKSWFSDPSTYPIIAIMGCAMCFMVGMGANALTTYKDVQIDPRKRNKMLVDWGTEHQDSVPKSFVRSIHKPNPEGLGIDHAKWEAEKKKYMES